MTSDLCSLRGNKERFAFSCLWEMTKGAKIVKTEFFKSIIKSKEAMTYEEAQLRIDDKRQTDNIALSLRRLNSLAKILQKKRMENGYLLSTLFINYLK